MKRIFVKFSFALSLLIAISCGNQNSKNYAEATADVRAMEEVQAEAASAGTMETSKLMLEDVEAPGPQVEAPVNPTGNQLKIIRRGNLSIESKDIQNSKQSMDALLKKMGGYYEQETSNSDASNLTSYNLTIRVPSHQLDAFLSSLEKGKDKITQKTMSSEDVSIQYYDLESRLKSKRAYLARYQEMVASAKNVKDLLEIQEQIRQLQEDIDSSESMMRSMAGQVNYSSLTINLFEYQANSPMGSNSFWSKLKDSIVFGWDLISNIFLGIVGLWPIWIVLTVIIFFVQRIRKRRALRFKEKNTQV